MRVLSPSACGATLKATIAHCSLIFYSDKKIDSSTLFFFQIYVLYKMCNQQSKSQSNNTEPGRSLNKEDLGGSSVVDPTLVQFHEFICHFTDNNLAINFGPVIHNRFGFLSFYFKTSEKKTPMNLLINNPEN